MFFKIDKCCVIDFFLNFYRLKYDEYFKMNFINRYCVVCNIIMFEYRCFVLLISLEEIGFLMDRVKNVDWEFINLFK